MSNNDFSTDSTKDKVVSAVGDVKDNVAAAASTAKDNVTAAAANAKSNVTSALHDAKSSTASAYGDARENAKGNPIGLLIGGVVVGAAIAAFLPVTDAERRRVQPIRDDLVDRATKAKDDVVKAGRGVLEETVSAATQAVNKHSEELGKELEADFKTGDGKDPKAVSASVDRGVDDAKNAASRTADNVANAVDKKTS